MSGAESGASGEHAISCRFILTNQSESPHPWPPPSPSDEHRTALAAAGICLGLKLVAGDNSPSPVQDSRVGPLWVSPAGAFHR